MLDLSEEPLEENVGTCVEYLTRMAKSDILLEMELGVTGGEEDGVDNSDVDSSKLYTQPEEVYEVYTALNAVKGGRFTIAAAFGNVHGVYSPGNVQLTPDILHNCQKYIKEKDSCEAEKPATFVFHGAPTLPTLAPTRHRPSLLAPAPGPVPCPLLVPPVPCPPPLAPCRRHSPPPSVRACAGGSGSSREDIRYAIEAGTVKMNIDTDTQCAARPRHAPYTTAHRHVGALCHPLHAPPFKHIRRPPPHPSDLRPPPSPPSPSPSPLILAPPTRWAFWDGLRSYEAEFRPYLQGQIGNPDGDEKPNKKYYDPRMALRRGEEFMAKRLIEAAEDLNCINVI